METVAPASGQRIGHENNFNLIRLAAATQVFIVHYLSFIPGAPPTLRLILEQAPGVPVFFLISGFLVSSSFERSPEHYVRNRALRIFPGLWASIILSLVLISVLHGPDVRLISWALAQGTLLQDWNPGFLRHYGVGVVNGALWTIPVELTFYALVPVIYGLGRRFRLDAVLIGTCTLSFIVLYGAPYVLSGMAYKAVRLSPLAWVGVFALGIFAQRHFELLRPYLEGKFLVWAAIFLIVTLVTFRVHAPVLLEGGGNKLGVFNLFSLAGLTLAAAYTAPLTANRLLMGNDISYGIYILHMPVFNALIASGAPVIAGFGITPMAAWISWRAIEKPALRRKQRSPGAPMVEAPTSAPGVAES